MTTADTPLWQRVLRDPVLLAAFGFGAGLARHGPGTWGSILALPLVVLLLDHPLAYALVTVAVSLVGIPLCGQAAQRLGVHDHPGIVWDEIAGQMIACVPLLWLPDGLTLATGLGLALVAFRVFDITKPWPIRHIDRRVDGGWGIMLDDLVAGLAAAVVVALVLRLIG